MTGPRRDERPVDYDLVVTDPSTGTQVLERSVASDATQAMLESAALGGLNDLSVTVGSECSAGSPARRSG